jgi:hypothetical protein
LSSFPSIRTRERTAAQRIEVRDLGQGRTYRESYDKLVLCLGAEPVRPPIPGADDPRVDVLRNIPDMDRIITQLDKDATSAVIVGGSYIGLELTEAFRGRGLATTVVERTERLMPWLDPEMTRILDYHVAAHEVDLRLGTSATAVRHGEDDRLMVDLSDRRDTWLQPRYGRPVSLRPQPAGPAARGTAGSGTRPSGRRPLPPLATAPRKATHMDPFGRRRSVGGRFVPRVEALPQAVPERAVELAVSALGTRCWTGSI